MGFWAFLNHWWNLPSLVMLGLVNAYFLMQSVGLAEHDGDGDIEADAELEHDVDVDAEHEVDHETDAESEHDLETASAGLPFASILGVGRVPFMIVWLTLFIFTGFSGLAINRFLFLHTDGDYRAWFFPISFAASLLIGVGVTSAVSRLVGRFFDLSSKGSTQRKELPGRPGVVASVRVDGEHGEVRVVDEHGNELIVHARIEGGREVMRGEQVVLLEYDEAGGLYTVAPL